MARGHGDSREHEIGPLHQNALKMCIPVISNAVSCSSVSSNVVECARVVQGHPIHGQLI